MNNGRIILGKDRFELMVTRLCHELIENYDRFEHTCLVGIQARGVLLADRIHQKLASITGNNAIPYGKMDITFYRDDFRTRKDPIRASATEMDFLVDGKNVVLIDDVLYTGRTVHAALTALNHYGRPEAVELLTLVDRRFNRHLPIKANYIGMVVDSLDEAYVKVDWDYDGAGANRVLIYSAKETTD